MKDYKRIENMRNLNESLIWERMKRCYDYGYEDGKADTPFTDTEKAEKKAYERGLDEAWKVATKIIEPADDGEYSFNALHTIFGESSIRSILKHNTAIEAIDKIKAYEDKQDAEIKVGDEVIVEHDGATKRAVIFDKQYGLYIALDSDGTIHEGVKEAFTKTGRTFPQIVEILAEMRGAENDE